MKISITIPAYNEEKRIGRTLEEYGKFFEMKKKSKEIEDFEIIVVINNTSDRTEEVVKEKIKVIREIRHLNFKKGGKGFAIIEGFKDALKRDSDLMGFVDADMATSPEAFYSLSKNINGYDGIIASRAVHGSKVYQKKSFIRIFASRVLNFLVRVFFLLPYRDTQCGAKIFRKRCIENIINRVGMTQWAFDIDLIYQAKKIGFRIKEFPTLWSDRDYSKLNVKKHSIQMLLAIIQLRILNSPFKRSWKFFRPVAGLIWRLVK